MVGDDEDTLNEKLNKKGNYFIIFLFSNCFLLDKEDNVTSNYILNKAKNNNLKYLFKFLPRFTDFLILKNELVLEFLEYLYIEKIQKRYLPFKLNLNKDLNDLMKIEISKYKGMETIESNCNIGRETLKLLDLFFDKYYYLRLCLIYY